MASIPYMPFYIADYMADAAHLSTLEHGAYLLLIMTYWQSGKPLPDDDLKLSRIVKLSEKKFQKVKTNVLEFFFRKNGKLHHGRIDKELQIYKEKSDKSRAAGVKSGESRREKKRTDVQRSFNECSTDVERTLNHADTDADTDADIKKNKEKKDLTPDVQKVFNAWVLTMNKNGAILGPKRISAINKAMKMGYEVNQLIDAIVGCSLTPFNCGKNKEGKRFDDLELIVRNESNIERFIENSKKSITGNSEMPWGSRKFDPDDWLEPNVNVGNPANEVIDNDG